MRSQIPIKNAALLICLWHSEPEADTGRASGLSFLHSEVTLLRHTLCITEVHGLLSTLGSLLLNARGPQGESAGG